MKIKCTLGILTFNCAETLERCLQSAKGFEEIIIADGGSTDGTLEIAKRYGARVISQSVKGKPIEDFAKERNLLLGAATEPWFFYLDSDEIASTELLSDIARITEDSVSPYKAYRVRYLKTNEDASRIYRTFKEYYQIRLLRTDIGAFFERKVHERIHLPQETSTGQIEGAWYVLLDSDDLSFSVFTRKAWKRTGMTAAMWKPQRIYDVLHSVFLYPFSQVVKSLVKMIGVKLRWGSDAIPMKYEILRIVYAFFLSLQHARRVFHIVFSRMGKEKQEGK